jgi:hypothetical protein
VRLPLIATILFVLACATKAEAILVDFTQVTYGPSSTLIIGGVTVTSSTIFNPVGSSSISTVEGIGLGVGTLAANGSIDRLMELTITGEHWLATGRDVRETPLTLTVDGEITAVTIQPHFTFTGPNAPAPLPEFIIGYNTFTPGWTSVPMFQYVDVDSPRTFQFPLHPEMPGPTSIVDLGVYDDFDWTRIILTDYMRQQGLTSVTAQFGFSITSVEYTPRSVPEPGTLSLLAIGAFCLLKRRYGAGVIAP